MKKGTIIAIFRAVAKEDAVPIAEVLMENGIDWIEVSLSDEQMGLETIEALSKQFMGKVSLGVGTVVQESQVDQALNAGAEYIITPGWDPVLIRYALSKSVKVFPGVFTPGEIAQALREGIEVLKLFPAATLGTSYIENLLGPFPSLHLMGVGGINYHNICEYFQAGCSSFAIGSDLVPRRATVKDIDEIRKRAMAFKQFNLQAER